MKRDSRGNLVSDKKSILALYKNEYVQRLAQKSPLPPYEESQKLKERLFNLRMDISSQIKSEYWQNNDISKICKTLKSGKARDRNGFIYELFKPPYAGDDLINSLTLLFNKIKDQKVIPEFLQQATITSFYKNRGPVSAMSSQRGVFCLSKVRSILDKRLHCDYYDFIDSNLCDSNVGGRKKTEHT